MQEEFFDDSSSALNKRPLEMSSPRSFGFFPLFSLFFSLLSDHISVNFVFISILISTTRTQLIRSGHQSIHPITHRCDPPNRTSNRSVSLESIPIGTVSHQTTTTTVYCCCRYLPTLTSTHIKSPPHSSPSFAIQSSWRRVSRFRR